MKTTNSKIVLISRKKLRTYLPALAAISMMLLAGCEKQIVQCDVPVIRANQCVKDNLNRADLAGCTLDYLDLIGKQQEALENVRK